MICLACNGSVTVIRSEHYEVRALGTQMELAFGLCEVCGLVQQTPPLSPETLARYYKNSLQLRTTEVSAIEREVFAAQAAFIGDVAGARVLEVGADTGQFLDHLGRLGAATFFAEYNDVAMTHARDDGGAYDLVVARHVLEHMSDPYAWLRTLKTQRLFIEVPDWTTVDAHTDGLAFEHTAYFSFASLQILLMRAGFAVTKFETAVTPGYPTSSNRVLRVMAKPLTRRAQVDAHLAAQRRPYERIAALSGRVAIYGASWRTQEALKIAKNVIAVFDKDPRKHGRNVFAPTEIARIKPDVIVILSAYEVEIRATLTGYRVIGWDELNAMDSAS